MSDRSQLEQERPSGIRFFAPAEQVYILDEPNGRRMFKSREQRIGGMTTAWVEGIKFESGGESFGLPPDPTEEALTIANGKLVPIIEQELMNNPDLFVIGLKLGSNPVNKTSCRLVYETDEKELIGNFDVREAPYHEGNRPEAFHWEIASNEQFRPLYLFYVPADPGELSKMQFYFSSKMPTTVPKIGSGKK